MTMERIDANIVVILDEPPAELNQAALMKMFETVDVQKLLKPPHSFSQALGIDTLGRGTSTSLEVESFRSQKTVSISAQRIDVHDRSDAEDIRTKELPETVLCFAELLGVEAIKAVGANYVFLITGDDEPAAKVIASRLLTSTTPLAPDGTILTGGSVRLFLSSDDGSVTYTAAIEPRLNDIETTTLFATLNINADWTEMPDLSKLSELFNRGYTVAHTLLTSLFNGPKKETR